MAKPNLTPAQATPPAVDLKAVAQRLFEATALVATSRSAVELLDNDAGGPIDTVYLRMTLDRAVDELQGVHSALDQALDQVRP